MAYLTKTVKEWSETPLSDAKATLEPTGLAAVIEVSGTSTRFTTALYCLPDTVDPRGPKGK